MAGFPDRGRRRRLRPRARHRGTSSLGIRVRVPEFPREDDTRRGLPVAGLILACCPSSGASRSRDALPATPWACAYMSQTLGPPGGFLPSDGTPDLPVKPCRPGRHFHPQMRVNRFVFLNPSVLSRRCILASRLRRTPHCPADYVTVPASGTSPPRGLRFSRHREPPGLRSSCEPGWIPPESLLGVLYVMSVIHT